MARLDLKTNQRVAFIGRTGSGKTYLAERLTAPLRRMVIIDPNGLLRGRFKPHVPWEKGLKTLEGGGDARLYVSLDRPEDYAPIFDHIYRRVNDVVVYIDEAYGVSAGSTPPPGLWALYMRGRAKGIGVWAATQRPRFIPRFMLSEAEWFFVFQLQLDDDREYLSRIIHPVLKQRARHQHGFYYWYIGWDKPRYTAALKGS